MNQLFVFLTAVVLHRTCQDGKCYVFPEHQCCFVVLVVFFSFWVGECCNLVLRFFTVLFLVCFLLSAFCRELKTINQLFVFLTAVSPHRTCPGGKCCVFPEY